MTRGVPLAAGLVAALAGATATAGCGADRPTSSAADLRFVQHVTTAADCLAVSGRLLEASATDPDLVRLSRRVRAAHERERARAARLAVAEDADPGHHPMMDDDAGPRGGPRPGGCRLDGPTSPGRYLVVLARVDTALLVEAESRSHGDDADVRALARTVATDTVRELADAAATTPRS